MKRTGIVTLSLCIFLATNLFSTANAADWVMSEDAGLQLKMGMSGVSPHVERLNGIDRIWRSDGPTGTVVSDCNDDGICTSVTVPVRLGADFTVVTFPNGSKRAYFKDMDASSQQVYSAPCNDAGCTSVGLKTATTADMRVPSNIKAWGVPDAVLLPDGRVRIYIVESPVEGKCTEKIASYISSDGITFTKEPGWRFENGYVDTEILRAKAGDYVMIMADIGCTSARRQMLFVSSSQDGLTWTTPELLTGAGIEGLDPTGYEVSPGIFRIYYAQGGPTQSFVIKRGTLRYSPAPLVTATPTPTATPTATATATATPTVISTTPAKVAVAKKITITCIKGKTIKKVTAINPKCPSGYKRK